MKGTIKPGCCTINFDCPVNEPGFADRKFRLANDGYRLNLKQADIRNIYKGICLALLRKAGDRGQALQDPLEHQFVLKMTHFWDKWVPEEPVFVPHPKR